MARATKGKSVKPKVPCENQGICGNTKNHIVGTFSQKRCKEITRRRAAGEEITAENVMNVRPPGMDKAPSQEAQQVRDKMDSLKGIVDGWKEDPESVLQFMRWSQQFTDYSPFNRMMIHTQNPNATRVAARKKWEEQEREVNEDAEAIFVFAPGSSGKIIEKDANGKPVLDENGKPKVERTWVNRFKSVPVYDISSTSGDSEPELPSNVFNREELQYMVDIGENEYGVKATGAPMDAAVPARVTDDGDVIYNTASLDEDQQMTNRLIGLGMAASIRVKGLDGGRKKEEDKWGPEEHTYAGVAAAWAIGERAGVDMSDLAVEKLASYKGKERLSTLVAHGAAVADHMDKIREGLPSSIADALNY